MKQILIFIGLCVIASISCRSPNSPSPLWAPHFQAPVATGIFITAETGDVVGVFGNPSSRAALGDLKDNSNLQKAFSAVIPTRFLLDVPYPNPSNGEMTIRFGLPKESEVAIFVVRASFMNHEGRIVQFSNATIRSHGGLATDILFNRKAVAGFHSVNWSGRDQTGNPFPDGFYRIYMQIGDEHLWQDVLLIRNICNAPAGLPIFGEGDCP